MRNATRTVSALALAGIALLAGTESVLADAGPPLPLDERVRVSDFIGVIEVVGTTPRSDDKYSDRRPGAGWLQVAIARVKKIVKGPNGPNDAIEIDFDNGLSCPNVRYRAGHRYLVFLARGTSGRLGTVNYDAGAYPIDQGHVDGLAAGVEGRIKLQSAIKRLKDLVRQGR